jgi:YVTN family beta-propeller protein
MSLRADPRIGFEFAGYRIEAVLGRGGTSVVYRAEDRRLQRKVALKLLAPELAEDERFRERFLRESRLAASLDHPNVIPIYEAGEADGVLFIAMRYVEQTDLKAIIEREGALEPERVLTLLGPVAGALDAAHARGLVHRDVKPGNILIAFDAKADPPEHVYLSDFGLTKQASSETRLTETGQFVGTPEYVAPEQIAGGPLEARTDLYALGCVLFECLTGEPPFSGDSLMAVLWSQVNDAPPKLSARRAGLPKQLDAVIDKALAKQSSERFTTGRELIETARAALALASPEPGTAPVAPTGTVTFVFTDIEGSTGLLKLLRDRYPEILAQQRELLRSVFAAYGGVEVDSQGDAFFVVFSRARQAGLATAEAQRALAEHPWPEGAEVRVRMALHTGEAEVADGRYHGMSVHRGARILAAGHGGQILLSQATASVLADEELPGIAVRSLGRYRLKDLDQPEHVHQLVAQGLKRDFAPLRAQRTRRLPRRSVLVATLGVAVAAAVTVPIFAVGGGSGSATLEEVTGNSVGLIDATTKRLVAAVDVGSDPARVAVGEGAVWVANETAGTVSRIDPAHRLVVDTTPVGSAPSGIAVGNNAVWVANGADGTVSRIHPGTNQVVDTVHVGSGPRDIAVGERGVWVANRNDRTVSRVHPRRGNVVETIPLNAAPSAIAAGAGAVWVTQEDSTVARIDPGTNSLLRTINVGNGPSSIAAGNDAVWVANTPDGTVSRIDPSSNAVTATIPVEGAPRSVAITPAGVWVASELPGVVSLIDAGTSTVASTIRLGNRPTAIAHGDGYVWVSVRAAGGASHVGGTLRAVAHQNIDSIDPGFAYTAPSWQHLSVTGDGLTGFRRVGGLGGTELVADLAVALPRPTNGGKTYTFQLRRGIRYSNGVALKAADVRKTIERLFKAGSEGRTFYGAIVGAAACERRPKTCDLSRGIVTDERARTVTFRLTASDSELLYKLALPTGYVVPPGTPTRETGTRPIPGTGPYRIARYVPNRTLRFERNPHFREWSNAAQPAGFPDEIVWRIGVPAERHVAEILAGRADYTLGRPDPDTVAEIRAQYPAQVHSGPVEGTVYVGLNTRVPPFDNVDVRRALNYAVDRGAVVKLAGGPTQATATCQILPPAFPGYSQYCPYTRNPNGARWTAPDLARAKALVARSGTRGMKVTVWAIPPSAEARYVARVLDRLGYRASVKLLERERFVPAVYTPATKAQAAVFWWFADYPAASNFFTTQFTCAGTSNLTQFCRPEVDAQIARALRLQVSNPQAANRLWARIDRQVVDQAPWVPLFNPVAVNFVSKRVGNYHAHPVFGMLVSQVWVR